MSEIDEAAEPQTAPIDPKEPPTAEGPSSSIDEGPDLAVIEALAEEDITWIPPTAVASPAKERTGTTAPSLASVAPVLEAVKGLGGQLTRRLDSLQGILEREQRAEASRERVVDRLHAELQEYKQDLLLKVQRPIFIDLIQLHDDIGKMIEARAPDDAEPERAAALRGILESIPDGDRGHSLSPGGRTVLRRGRHLRPPPAARGLHGGDRRTRPQQDHRRPTAERVPGRRQADPPRDRFGVHAATVAEARPDSHGPGE